MADIDPYQTPGSIAIEIDRTAPSGSRVAAVALFLFVVLPMLFGLVGFAGYIAIAITLERQATGTGVV